MHNYAHIKNMDVVISSALFIVMEGLSAVPAMAGDGVVVLERVVPARPAYRDGALGSAISIDTSPDDKVHQAINGQQPRLHSTELSDAEFATVSSGSPQAMGSLTKQIDSTGLSNTQFSDHGLSGSTGIQPIATNLTGTIDAGIGGVTGHIANEIVNATGALSNLTGSIMHSSGQ
ncbi:hypothetical protein GALL_269310 [mine drainage metagenome]|uniref:Uncharacterized protein n=1 Tax=mine drainage metagenome TaxID=410659 RepID=A0A1J5R5B3_9ZZZZ